MKHDKVICQMHPFQPRRRLKRSLASLCRAGSIIIFVTDSGAGLFPQQLAEICSEGVQFNADELQASQGSGLGLFISKGIVEQYGGELTAV